MASSKYAIRVCTSEVWGLGQLGDKAPITSTSPKYMGTHKSGALRVIRTAPAGCQMIVPFKGDEVKNVFLGCKPQVFHW
jgi:hypothetical protein